MERLLDINNDDDDILYLQHASEDGPRTYFFRWVTVLMFVLSGVANAMILLSFSPITDKAELYWPTVDITAINLLNVIFQITYLPGTLMALHVSSTYNLRTIILCGGCLTTVGCAIRLVSALNDLHGDGGLGSSGSYALMLIGTSFVGLAQPFYINMPAKIATTWFRVSERDIATTICSLANPLGSAVGSFIPPIFVSTDRLSAIRDGVQYLTLTQFAIAGGALIMVSTFFQNEPPTPPSLTAGYSSAKGNQKSVNMMDELGNLFSKVEYMKLFFSFTIILGNLNALAALLNQLPGNYSNGQVGLTGALLIVCGFIGAFCTGLVLDYTKAYRTVLKSAFTIAVACWIFFLVNCRANQFELFLLSACLLGFFTLPTIPATIVSAVECAYPVPEDATLGVLYIGANVCAIAFTFIGQVLLGTSSPSSFPGAPFFPYGIWLMGLMVLSLLPIALFRGKYLRLEEDTAAAGGVGGSRKGPLMS